MWRCGSIDYLTQTFTFQRHILKCRLWNFLFSVFDLGFFSQLLRTRRFFTLLTTTIETVNTTYQFLTMSQLKKTNLNSVNDLRQTTDDHLGLVFQQLGYNESFTLIDLKLGLDYPQW